MIPELTGKTWQELAIAAIESGIDLDQLAAANLDTNKELWDKEQSDLRFESRQAAYAAFDKWREEDTEIPGHLIKYLDFEARRMILDVLGGHLPPPGNWLSDADTFICKELPERKPLLVDTRTGGVVLFQSSINQLFAFRGIGKSVVINALLRPLLTGKDWLHFRSRGGLKVLLVDGELPSVQLQERLREFAGDSYDGLLRILSPELMRNSKAFPILSRPEDQEKFIRRVEAFGPDVIVFDTLSSCFKMDTNDADQWTIVNDFLRRLRFMGHCVLLVHHAGKNNTQRGRTDGDDNLDVSIQLQPRQGWQPGDGLVRESSPWRPLGRFRSCLR
jgi:hypothetical protein